MISGLRLENFKSFDKSARLTMVSSSKIRANPEHCVDIPKTARILKNAVIYGANAAGKSNLIDFFRLFHMVLADSIPLWAMDWFSKSKEGNRTRPTVLEIQFSVQDKFYAYGFSAVLNERRIVEEWLYSLSPYGAKAKRLLHRIVGKEDGIVCGKKLDSEDSQRFLTYAKDFSKNSTGLFLTELSRGKSFKSESVLSVLQSVQLWLLKHIVVFSPSSPITDFRYYYNEESLTRVNDLIRTFDTGISAVAIQTISLDEFKRKIHPIILQEMLMNVQAKLRDGAKIMKLSMRSQDDFFSLVFASGDEPIITTLKLRHGNSFYDFSFNEESDGTRRVFDLLDMLLTEADDTVFVIDELERSLHPMLTKHFLELFNEKRKKARTQLIFTTHEDAILDQNLFRRDEIWFVERDSANNSRLYSLDRFKERYDRVLGKAYLEGRYGAIPVFSSFSFDGEGNEH